MPTVKQNTLCAMKTASRTEALDANRRSSGWPCLTVDTDVQYVFTRAIPGHFFKDYDGVLKFD
jgi:hypothetical protein